MKVKFYYKQNYVWCEMELESSIIPRVGETVEIIFPDFELVDTFTVKDVTHMPKFDRIEIELITKNEQ